MMINLDCVEAFNIGVDKRKPACSGFEYFIPTFAVGKVTYEKRKVGRDGKRERFFHNYSIFYTRKITLWYNLITYFIISELIDRNVLRLNNDIKIYITGK